jgi:hypothetical protein
MVRGAVSRSRHSSRVHPSCSCSTNADDVTVPCVRIVSTIACGGSSRSTTNPVPSRSVGSTSPTCRCCSSGTISHALLRIAGIAEELSAPLDMQVDVVTDALLRDQVATSAHTDAVAMSIAPPTST